MLKKKTRIFILGLLDIITVVISSFASIYIRFDGFAGQAADYLENVPMDTLVTAVISLIVLVIFKLYSRVWTYASYNELMSILAASFVIEIVSAGCHMFLMTSMPRSFYLIQFLLMVIGFSITRFSKVMYRKLKGSIKSEKVRKRILIVGAGAAAALLIKEIEGYRSSFKVVCAIDDNVNKKNKYIGGVPIVGTRENILKACDKYDIDEIIIAMPSVSQIEIKKIISICQKTGLSVKILPALAKSLTTSVIKEVRDVNYEDLLGRDPVVVNHEGINEFLQGKTIMVTGGGGSIGSELCRQIMKYNPRHLIIFDIYENNAYEIQMELEGKYPDKKISTIIGSIRDYDRLEMIFKEYRPEVIYHAAAHKHVPLMENSPNEAIKNNCLGTYNVAKLAKEYKTEKFILISTDKAVRPTNIMGATKRICEMIVQTFDKNSDYTRYAAVRFGNVLGSNGSVIPLFLKQIENGGPVTVTHKEITRFFMTIPEAVSLVLEAGVGAKGGEIFVLDMGKPVKIYDLAENLIRMQGYVPNKDIMIEIIGLRPGEKLYEELLMEEEGLTKTENQLIYIGKPIDIDEEKFIKDLKALVEAAKGNAKNIKELTAKVCGTYTISDQGEK